MSNRQAELEQAIGRLIDKAEKKAVAEGRDSQDWSTNDFNAADNAAYERLTNEHHELMEEKTCFNGQQLSDFMPRDDYPSDAAW